MKLTTEVIEQTITLLTDHYGISTQLINKLLESHNLESCEDILLLKLNKKEKLSLLLGTIGSLFFAGSGDEAKQLRAFIIDQWDLEIIWAEFDKHCNTAGNTKGHKVRKLSEKRWHNGKGWANSFVSHSGLDSIFAGIAKESKNQPFEDIAPYIKIPELKDFQIQLKDDLISTLNQNGDKAKCMVSLPTGGGKTRTAMEAYVEWLRPRFVKGQYLLWIAQSEELCEQAISSVRQVWSSKEFTESLRVFRFFGSHKVSFEYLEEGGVIVCSIQKLYKAIENNTDEIRYIIENCGAIIVDEAHRAITMMYETLYRYAQAIRGEDMFPICGLTATPGRNLDADKLTGFFNYKLFTPRLGGEFDHNPLRYFRDLGYLATPFFMQEPTGHSIDIPLHINDVEGIEEYFRKTQNKVLAGSAVRNRKIIRRLRSIPSNQQTLVYTCTVEHAKLLSSIMNYHGRSSVAITSDTHNALRYRYIDQFKKGEIEFIFNHSVLTTGFDAPKTENIVICRPIFSDVLYEQIVGRGLRGEKFGGTSTCNIIDFSDSISRLGDQQSYKRYIQIWE